MFRTKSAGHTQGHYLFITPLGMMAKFKKYSYVVICFLLSILFFSSASAETGGTGDATGGTGSATGGTGDATGGTGSATGGAGSNGPLKLSNPLGTENIMDVINSVLNYLIYISVPILAFFILWGGFQILTARDDPEKVKNGKATIKWAVLGFAIILISKGVALILLTILKG